SVIPSASSSHAAPSADDEADDDAGCGPRRASMRPRNGSTPLPPKDAVEQRPSLCGTVCGAIVVPVFSFIGDDAPPVLYIEQAPTPMHRSALRCEVAEKSYTATSGCRPEVDPSRSVRDQ